MALRDQPYLPLYVQDFLTDEKLSECSAQSTGVYIRLMCLMHKSDEYGVILLKQKDKQKDKQISNFACKLARNFPYPTDIIEAALEELLAEGVINLDGDRLFQKRMVKDGSKSKKRATAGASGGRKTQEQISFAKANIQANNEAKGQAKEQANLEIEYENENENNNETDINTDNELNTHSLNSNSPEAKKKTGSRACAKRHKHGVYGRVLLTEDEYKRLLLDLGETELKRCIAYVDESAQKTDNRNEWKDWNLVLRNCNRDGWGAGKGDNRGSRSEGATAKGQARGSNSADAKKFYGTVLR